MDRPNALNEGFLHPRIRTGKATLAVGNDFWLGKAVSVKMPNDLKFKINI